MDSKENIVYKKVGYNGTALFDLEKTTISGITSTANAPGNFQLFQNFPNPFNQATIIRFNATKIRKIDWQIFDINGRLIRKYSQIRSHPGLNEVTWNGLNEQGKAVGSGVYFYRISGSRFTQTKKMLLIR